MKFRRIYWVTEQIDNEGKSQVVGVYTSIPDLMERGLRWDDACGGRAHFRLNLVQLDANSGPLGTWTSPDFAGLNEDVREYVQTGEMNDTDCSALVDACLNLAKG